MTNASNEADDLQEHLPGQEALEPAEPRLEDAFKPVLTVKSAPRPRGRDNKGSGRRGG